MITVKLADLAIGIDNKYTFMEALAKDYITDEAPVFSVSVTDAEIEEERVTERETKEYLESIAIYRKIAEKLPEYDAFVFHAATLNFEGEALAFTARSGVGKTTHTRLWIEVFGRERVHYLNGDKPIVRFVDGSPVVYGTPYRGKEGYGRCESAPLRAVTFVERGEVNTAEPISKDDAVMRIASQVYMPRSSMSALRTLKLIDRFVGSAKLVLLKCTPDPEAAEVAKRAVFEQ